ncbi:MAG: hypothetical protein ACH34X_03175 [Thiolinea sp.]
MSLVVAKIINSNVIIVSDTKITLDDKIKQPHTFTEGFVKTIVIDQLRCLAYAGALTQEKHDELLAILSQKTGTARLIDFLSNLSADKAIDFIFCSIENTESILLLKISEGSVSEAEHTWIGDHEGFNLFQSYFHKPTLIKTPPSSELHLIKIPDKFIDLDIGDTYTKMINAMKGVIESSRVDSVGGFVTPVVTEENIFKYGNYFSIYRQPYSHEELSKGGALSFGDHTTGTYSINFADQGRRSFAVHIFQGKFGLILNNEENINLNWIKALNKDEIDFVSDLKTTFNQDTTLCIHVGHSEINFFLKGNIFFDQENYIVAIEHYEKGLEILDQRKLNNISDGKNIKIALNQIFKCYFKLNDKDNLIKTINLLENSYPNDTFVQNLKNNIYQQLAFPLDAV